MYYSVMENTSIGAVDRVKIEELMKARNIKNHAELARLANLDRSTLSRLLKGRGRQAGNAKTLSALATALETTVDYIRGQSHDPRRSNAEPLPEYALEIIAAMKYLKRTQKYELLLIAKSFVEASEQVHRISREDVIELLLDYGDMVAGEEETNRVMELLQRLDEKRHGEITDDSALILTPPETSDPGE